MSNIVTVDFKNDTLFAVERDDGVYVALRPIVEAMGMDWSAQLQRIKRDTLLSEGVVMIPTPFSRHNQEETCIKLEQVNGWLFTIDDKRIKDEDVRQKVLEYKRECYQVLHEHFFGKQNPLILEAEPSDSESRRRMLVSEARQTFGAHAAGELWFKLGLPVTPSMIEQGRQLSFIDYKAIRTIGDAAV